MSITRRHSKVVLKIHAMVGTRHDQFFEQLDHWKQEKTVQIYFLLLIFFKVFVTPHQKNKI